MNLEQIPHVMWPTGRGLYKAVQFTVNDQPYLRFGIAGQYYHKDIVRLFAKQIGVETVVRDLVDLDGRWLPFLPEERGCKIDGMGRCDLNPVGNTARFYDSSVDYRIGINQDHLELIKRFSEGWNITHN